MATTSTERVRAMRERRRQALQATDAAEVALRPADHLLAPAVEHTIGALELAEQDAAAAQLARGYARVIDTCRDQSWGYRWVGPLLAGVLADLQATPASRKAVKQPPAAAPNRLQQLREARAASDARRRGV